MRGILFVIAAAVALVAVLAPTHVVAAARWAMGLCLGLALFGIVRVHVRDFRAGRTDRETAIRRVLVDVIRVVISLGVSITLAGRAAVYLLERLPGLAGFMLAIAVAMLVGIAVNLMVRYVFSLRWIRFEGRVR